MSKDSQKSLAGKHIALLVCSDYFLDPRSKKAVSWLVDAGVNVTVITTSLEIPASYQQPNCSIELVSFTPDYRSSQNSFWPARVFMNTFWHRVRNKILTEKSNQERVVFATNLFVKRIVEVKPDLIYAVNAYTLDSARIGAEILGIPFVYDAHEFWPDHRKDPVNTLSPKQRELLKEYEEKAIVKAAETIAVGDYLADETVKEYGIKRPYVIYNAPLTRVEETQPCHTPVKLLFQGNLNPERNVMALLEAMTMIAGANLTFQGGGVYADTLRESIKELGLEDRVFIIEPVPYEFVSEAASQHDVGIVCHKAYDRQMEGATPNKFFDGLSGGLAMAVSDTQAFRLLPGVEDAVFFIDPTSAETIARGLKELVADPDKISAMKQAALKSFDLFSKEKQAEVLVGLVCQALHSKGDTHGAK